MKCLQRILCLTLILIIPLAFHGCANDTFSGDIDLNFHGTWIVDGEAQNKLSFTLKGTLPTDFEHQSVVNMELDFIWPESTGYSNDGMQTYTGHAEYATHNGQPIYHGGGIIYTASQDNTFLMSYTLFPAEEYIVLRIGHRHLVASADPDADPAAILELYKQYVTDKALSARDGAPVGEAK